MRSKTGKVVNHFRRRKEFLEKNNPGIFQLFQDQPVTTLMFLPSLQYKIYSTSCWDEKKNSVKNSHASVSFNNSSGVWGGGDSKYCISRCCWAVQLICRVKIWGGKMVCALMRQNIHYPKKDKRSIVNFRIWNLNRFKWTGSASLLSCLREMEQIVQLKNRF
jgi:hypothetical protein